MKIRVYFVLVGLLVFMSSTAVHAKSVLMHAKIMGAKDVKVVEFDCAKYNANDVAFEHHCFGVQIVEAQLSDSNSGQVYITNVFLPPGVSKSLKYYETQAALIKKLLTEKVPFKDPEARANPDIVTVDFENTDFTYLAEANSALTTDFGVKGLLMIPVTFRYFSPRYTYAKGLEWKQTVDTSYRYFFGRTDF
jgi:hypothetical protein